MLFFVFFVGGGVVWRLCRRLHVKPILLRIGVCILPGLSTANFCRTGFCSCEWLSARCFVLTAHLVSCEVAIAVTYKK